MSETETKIIGEVKPPQALSIVSGHVLAGYTHQADAGNGQYSHGVALFVAPSGAYHSHVVWTLIYNSDAQQWVAEGGDYCFGLPQALTVYKHRGGAVN